MSKRVAIDFSTPLEDLLGGGGGLINPGPYKVVVSHFRMDDFGGKAKNGEALVLYQKLQPVDKDGEDEGEEIERKWATGDKLRDGAVVLEAVNPIKGTKGAYSGIAFTEANTHGKIYAKSEFGIFIEHAAKAELDMDAIGNDITAMEDNIYEFGLYTWPERAKTKVEEAEEDEGGDKKKKFDGPKQTVIIVGEFDTGKKSKSKSDSKKKKDEDEDEDEKPKSSKKPAKSKKDEADEPDDAEGWLKKYLDEEVCTDDNAEDGVGHLDHKLNIPKWLDKAGADAKMKKSVMTIYNDVEEDGDGSLLSILETLGWEYKAKKKTIVKKED